VFVVLFVLWPLCNSAKPSSSPLVETAKIVGGAVGRRASTNGSTEGDTKSFVLFALNLHSQLSSPHFSSFKNDQHNLPSHSFLPEQPPLINLHTSIISRKVEEGIVYACLGSVFRLSVDPVQIQ